MLQRKYETVEENLEELYSCVKSMSCSNGNVKASRKFDKVNSGLFGEQRQSYSCEGVYCVTSG